MLRLLPAVLIALLGASARAQDGGDAPVGVPDAGSGSMMVIEELTPVEAFVAAGGDAGTVGGMSVESFDAPAPSAISARVYGSVWGLASIDTRFDSPPKVDMAENVAELRLKGLLGV